MAFNSGRQGIATSFPVFFFEITCQKGMDGAGGYLRQSGQLPLQFLLQARNACHCCRLFLVLSPLFNIDINPCRYFDVCSFPADSYGKVRLPMGLLCVKTDHNTLIEKTVKLRTSRLISMQYEHRPLKMLRGRWECSAKIAQKIKVWRNNPMSYFLILS